MIFEIAFRIPEKLSIDTWLVSFIKSSYHPQTTERTSHIERCSFILKSPRDKTMSLKFGIYLVEQRVISAEQFCGLVKIQQESSHTMATVALRKNLMTIKQVDYLLGQMNAKNEISFEELALEKGIIDSQDLNIMRQAQEASCTTIRQLLVECGLLTRHQTTVLFEHYEKLTQTSTSVSHKATATPAPKQNFGKTVSPTPTPTAKKPAAMPQPKFQQRRPVIQRLPTN